MSRSNGENNEPIVVKMKERTWYSALIRTILLPTSSSGSKGITDPIQIKRQLKNGSKWVRYGAISTCIMYGLYLPIQMLYSSLIDYATVQIKVATIIDASKELKENGLEYSPEAMIKYGIIQTEKAPRSNDPEDNRFMQILLALFNKMKFSSDSLVLVA